MPRQIVGKKPTFPEPQSQIPMLRAEISQARLLPYHSAPRDSLFTFQYRVELTNNSADWLTITRRYWEFDDAGEMIKVEAVSVGGRVLPRIAPGQTHSYVTAVPFHVPFGRIQGHFSAQIEGGGETFAEVQSLRFEASHDDIRAGNHNRAAPIDLALTASLSDLTAIGKWTRRSTNTSGNDNQPKQLRTDELAVSLETRRHLERWILKSFYIQYEDFNENNASRSLVKFSDIHSSFHDVLTSDVFMLEGEDDFYVILDYAPNVHRILQRSLDGRAERRRRLPLLGKVSEEFYLALTALLEREGVKGVARARILDEIRLVSSIEGTKISLLNGISDGKDAHTETSPDWKATVSSVFDSQFSHLPQTDRAKAEAVVLATFSGLVAISRVGCRSGLNAPGFTLR